MVFVAILRANMVSADVIIIVTDEVFRFVMAVVLIMFMVFSDILGSDYGFWALKTTTDFEPY